MTEQVITIIVLAIPVSFSLAIVVLVSLGIKKERKPVIKTWACEVLPAVLKNTAWFLFCMGLLFVLVYLWGEAGKQFGVLGLIGFPALISYLTRGNKSNKRV